MKWKTKKDIYNKGKKVYFLSVVRKCSGAYDYERITAKLSFTGTSWFPEITAKYLYYQIGARNKNNTTRYTTIQKHFGKDFWGAKEFCEFLINNFPSYVKEEWKK